MHRYLPRLLGLRRIDPPHHAAIGLDHFISRHPGQKAIIASGFSETEAVKKTQALGAGSYIKKPYTIKNLGLAVKRELSRNKTPH